MATYYIYCIDTVHVCILICICTIYLWYIWWPPYIHTYIHDIHELHMYTTHSTYMTCATPSVGVNSIYLAYFVAYIIKYIYIQHVHMYESKFISENKRRDHHLHVIDLDSTTK